MGGSFKGRKIPRRKISVGPIENGVLLQDYPARHPGARYPWADLKIGTSFEVQHDSEDQHVSIRVMSSKMKKKLGWGLEVRRTENGTRVWRTK